jgi:hypothetical protein
MLVSQSPSVETEAKSGIVKGEQKDHNKGDLSKYLGKELILK